MADDREDALVEIPAWVKRVRPNAPKPPRKRTLSERLREATGESDDVIDLAEVERDIERLRSNS